MSDNINLIEIAQEAFQVLSFNAESKEIKLCLQIDKSMPFILKKVNTDKRRILQIFLNFISNSIKFTNQNGVIKIKFKVLEEQVIDEIDIQSNDTYADINKFIKLKIQIEDNGMGIKKENIDKLFTDYQKLDEHKELNAKGTGLGLSVCKQIIELMGGKVSVNSLHGIGTKIDIILQLKCQDRQYFNPNIQTQSDKIKYLESQLAFNLTENFKNNFQKVEIDDDSLGIPSDENLQQKSQQIQESEFIFLDSEIEEYRYTSVDKIETQEKDDSFYNQIQKMIKKMENIKIQNKAQMEKQSLQMSMQSYIMNTSKLNSGQLQYDLIDLSNIDNNRIIENNMGQYIMINNEVLKQKPPIKNEIYNVDNHEFIIGGKQSSNSSYLEKFDKRKQMNNSQIQGQQDQYNQYDNDYLDGQIKQNLNLNVNNFPSFQASDFEQFEDQQQQIEQIFQKIQESKLYKVDKQQQNKSMDVKQIKQEQYLKQSIKLLKKYNKKKLRVLVANDNTYSLFVVQTTLESFNFIQTVDSAQNGQIALELVQNNEKSDEANTICNNKHFYDVIFLDLDMPIMNGYEACQTIKKHYRKINQNSISEHLQKQLIIESHQQQSECNLGSHANEIFKNFSLKHVPEWIVDLKAIYDKYQDLIAYKKRQNQAFSQQSSNESEKLSEIEIKILKIFNILYINNRYQILQYMKRPFIFAYSAMINSQVQEKTQMAGFDQCFDSPLNKIKIEKSFTDYINLFVMKMTIKMMGQLGNVSSFVEMIDDARVRRLLLESSSEQNKSLGSFVNTSSNPSKEMRQIINNEISSSYELEQSLEQKERKSNIEEEKYQQSKYDQLVGQLQPTNKLSDIIEEKDECSYSNQSQIQKNTKKFDVEFEIEIEKYYKLYQNQNFLQESENQNQQPEKQDQHQNESINYEME